MNFDEKGWFGKYLDKRKKSYVKKEDSISPHPDFSLYNLLQPTGILYGNPVMPENLDKDSFKKFDKRTRLKVLLAESLINSFLLAKQESIATNEDFARQIDLSVSHVIDFFNKLYPDIAVSNRSILGKARPILEVAEKIIEKRIDLKQSNQDNFWIGFFSTTLLFLDIYFFGQWIHTSSDKLVTDYFKEEKEELRLSVIKVIVAAAHANHIVEVEERRLFEYILNTADLSKNRIREAWALLENGLMVEEIALPENNSWLLRKYFLEIAILTVSADRIVDQKEQEFLENFTKHLGFFIEDLDDSMIALEGFIIENWSELDELQNRKNFNQLSEEYENRLAILLGKHTKKLNSKLMQNEPVKRLIRKYNEGTISPEENDRLHEQLISLLQKLPAFSSFKLPGSYLSTEHLMKMLPALPE